MEYALFSAFAALIVALVLTPIIKKLAVKFGVVAATNHRTIHSARIPKLGGLSIFAAFTIGTFFYASSVQELNLFLGLWIGGLIVACLGFLDDIYTLTCYRKLIFQTLAGIIAVYFGFQIKSATLPFTGTFSLGWFTIPLSLLWIVGVTNAINLLDGLDGLASGFSILLGLLIIVISGFTENIVLASLTLILITSTLGFLKYNFPPAKIFMGDTGSLFLGFCLACLSIKAFTFDSMGTHLGALFVPFSVPITDTLLAIVRRTSEGNHPFSADKKHIHHRLLDLGYNQYSAVFIIYAATIVFAIVGVIIIFMKMHYAILFLTAIFTIFFIGLFQLDCFDFIVKKQSFEDTKQIGINQESGS